VAVRHRLHRLARLAAPPATPGRARPAVAGDAPLLEAWLRAFTSESGAGMGDPGRTVAERLDHDGWVLWEDDAGEPVAMAGLTLPAAGVVRVAPVYTPPDRRRRGFGAAVTAAVTATGLAQGARDVVLFTDVANPTANALYARLGYLPVEERVTIRLERGAA
jgi:predicted GNAT family acetyltransferase